VSETGSPNITLPMIYTAVLDFRAEVIEHLEAQRAKTEEAISLLFRQGEVHRERLDEHEAKIENIEAEAQDLEKRQIAAEKEIVRLREWKHDLNGKLGPLMLAVEEIRSAQVAADEKIADIEAAMRKDTQLLPPPMEQESG